MIRLARESDAAAIGQMWAEMARYHAQFDSETFRMAENGAEVYALNTCNRLRDPEARVLVADHGGALVGFVSGMIVDITTEMFLPLRCGYLADLYVAREYRRRGLGTALVERLCLWFRARDVAHFEWQVSASNHAGLAFWQRIGGATTMVRMRAPLEGRMT